MENALPQKGELNKSNVAHAPRSQDRGRLRQRLALFLSGAGLLVLLYVSLQYWQMYAGQKALAHAWQQQNTQPKTIVAGEGDALIRLRIAKINLDAVIVNGTSHKALKLGPGHLEASAFPGSAGNSVIVAHRDTFFRHLDELKTGDEIDLQRQGQVYRFEVAEHRVVEPTDLSALRPSSSAQLTLITCYPIYYVGPAPKRLVVVAHLMPPLETAQKQR